MVFLFISLASRGDGDAAVPRFRIKDRVQAVGAQASDEALHQREVHGAGHLGPQYRQAAERAIAHPDGAMLVMPWLEAVLRQCALHDQSQGVALGATGSAPL